MADSSFLLSTISLAQMEPIGSKGCSGGLWLIWVLTLADSFSDGGFSCWYRLDCG
uniref:Uncharacterized protein n=1 Tax=Fagus sylvatica TaxID=28930 RepID=A0A2N9EZ01_FAGSY